MYVYIYIYMFIYINLYYHFFLLVKGLECPALSRAPWLQPVW